MAKIIAEENQKYDEMLKNEENEKAKQEALLKARAEAIKEANKITQIIETNYMTKNIQKMKIDCERTRSDSCSSCNYVFKTEEIRNVENIKLYEDIDFSEEVDEEASFNQTEDNGHISAVFDAIQSDKINIAANNDMTINIVDSTSQMTHSP